jgi:hypothetical protein
MGLEGRCELIDARATHSLRAQYKEHEQNIQINKVNISSN